MGTAAIKEAVRARCGNVCGKCGMTNARHREVYGVRLHVHRLNPGSPYAVAGCVLRCFACHGSEPKSPPFRPSRRARRGDRVRAKVFRLPVRLIDALHGLAAEHRRSYTAELELAIEHYLSKRKRLPQRPADTN
jgi:hypothetical protein